MSHVLSTAHLTAADGIWIDTSTGPLNWSDSSGWQSGVIATGSTSLATFGSNIAATSTINLDGSREIGNLTFSDNGASGSAWLLASGNGSILTLGDGVTAGTSTIDSLTGTDISLTLAGANRLSKTGGGRLWLTGTNTYSGGTTINNFYLGIRDDASLGSVPTSFSSDHIIFNSGTLSNFTGANNSGITLHVNRGILLASGTARFDIGTSTMTVNGAVSGTGNLSKTSNGTLILNGANSFSGATSISNGSLSVASLNSVVGGTSTSNLGAPVTASAGTIALGGGTSTGNLVYSGSGETTDRVINLAGTTGGGVIDQSGSGLLKFTSALAASGAGVKTLTLQGATAGKGEIAGAIINHSGTNTTALTKSGTGTWALSAANSYSGATTAGGGVLRLDHVGALPGGIASTGGTSALIFSGGIIGLTTASGDFTRSIGSATPSATQVGWASGGSGGFAAFGGDRIVNFGGAGALVSWTSSTGVFNAGLILSHETADSMVTLANPINLNVTGARTITVNDGSAAVDASLAGVVSQNASRLIKAGAGTLALTAANTFGANFITGNSFLTISSGTLQLGNGGTNGALTSIGNGDIENNGTLAINRSNAVNLPYVIKGSGSLSQIGSGITTISALNTYSGATEVISGALLIGGTASTGTGAVSVHNGATLLGSGDVRGGSFKLLSGAALLSGDGVSNSDFGTLSFTVGAGSAVIDLQAGSQTTLGLNPGDMGDLLVFDCGSEGSLFFNGNLAITAPGFLPTSVWTFNLIDWSNFSSMFFHSRFEAASYSGLLLGNGDDSLGFDLPDISRSGFGWDISDFVADGTIRVAAIPEPSGFLFLAASMTCMCCRRQRILSNV